MISFCHLSLYYQLVLVVCFQEFWKWYLLSLSFQKNSDEFVKMESV